ncbi:hypothetical protein ASPNIDRAFT_45315 [Aspergillus niger ATCC 1015]|uniref:Uncharacterized protein n=2 Tax=Aspergillus niger TaxID=5061 RepID=G3Y9M3_ASPNA|nr:hypothetical protein ASPNIDRAFT_45315 [Aspergillus niger ATCC 1015]RDH14333.1 hypothetical protein M747DRAFT_290677 [Aspergillus niger ATCC 13496]
MARGAGTWTESPGKMVEVVGTGGVQRQRSKSEGDQRKNTEENIGQMILIETQHVDSSGITVVPERAQEWKATHTAGQKGKMRSVPFPTHGDAVPGDGTTALVLRFDSGTGSSGRSLLGVGFLAPPLFCPLFFFPLVPSLDFFLLSLCFPVLIRQNYEVTPPPETLFVACQSSGAYAIPPGLWNGPGHVVSGSLPLVVSVVRSLGGFACTMFLEAWR